MSTAITINDPPEQQILRRSSVKKVSSGYGGCCSTAAVIETTVVEGIDEAGKVVERTVKYAVVNSMATIREKLSSMYVSYSKVQIYIHIVSNFIFSIRSSHYLSSAIIEHVETQVEDAVLAHLPDVFLEIRKFIEAAPLSNRVLGFIAGAIMLITGLINFIFDFLTLHWDVGIVDATVIAIGMLAMLIEYKIVFIPSRFLRYLKEDVRFLFRPYGRPLVYCFGGTFIVSKGSFLTWPLNSLNILAFENLCVGVCVMLISFLIIWHTYLSLDDLHKIRSETVDFNVLISFVSQ